MSREKIDSFSRLLKPEIPIGRNRLWVFVVMCFCFTMTAFAQEQKVTLNVKNADISVVFRQIKAQTKLNFVYDADQLASMSKVTLSVRNERVGNVLDKLFAGTPFEYRFEMQSIIVRKKPIASKADDNRSVEIKGKVIDSSGLPLPGVAIQAKGTTLGTTTDLDGNYQLTLPKGVKSATLAFSYLGMETYEVVADGKRPLNVKLMEKAESLDNVIVTGYFNKNRESFTGAATQVKREELRKFGNMNILQALSLTDPSLKLKENNQMGSDPNSLPDFVVRGESSFLGESNAPTFIVDGFEVSLQYVYDMDLDRIESLTILKDASATILYGSRAANGVIVIETRRPTAGKVDVSYSNRTSLSIADLTDYDLMNAQEKLEFEEKAGLYTSKNGFAADQLYLNELKEKFKSNIARGVDTDWLAQPVRNAVSHSHSLYVTGGDALTYGLGINYSKNNGVMKKSYREVFGLSFDLIYRIKNKMTIRNSFSYSQSNNQNSPYGTFSDYANANPYNPIRDMDGNFVKNYTDHTKNGAGTASQYQNWVYNASLPYKDEGSDLTVTNNLNVDWYITKRLRFNASLVLNKGITSTDMFISPEHAQFKSLESDQTGLDDLTKGQYRKGHGNSFSYNLNATLNYNMNWSKHVFFWGLGMNLNSNESNSDGYTATGFLDERFSGLSFARKFMETKPNATEATNRMVGYFLNLNYSYDNRYFMDFSTRFDGSSKYGKDERFAPMWSVGAGWNIANEHFLDNWEWLNRLTLRASVGLTGNQSFDSYVARTTLQYDLQRVYYDGLGATFMSYGNENLKWQRSMQRNIGLDVELFNRRLTLGFNYYHNVTDGLLLPVSVAPSLGFTSYTENFGEQSNKGYDVNINAVVLRTKDFDWAVSFSGMHNVNRIEKISDALRTLNERNNDDEQTEPMAMYEEGESVNVIKAVQSLGINPATGREQFLTKDGKITETWNWKDKVVCGTTDADLEGTIGTNVMWKNFSLNVTMRYSLGSQLYNSTLAQRVEGADPKLNADRRVLTERWQKPGDHTFYKDIADRSVSNVTSRFVQDNDYLECSNIALSYRIPREYLKTLGLSNVRIALNTNNLFHISTIKRERGTSYPFARQYTLSLNLNF